MEGDKVEELLGGINNALNRGETLDAARIAYLNAGYPPQIVDMAINQIAGGEDSSTHTIVEHNVSVPQSNLNLYAQQQASRPVQQQSYAPQKRYSHMPIPYWAVILMLLISLLIVVGAGVLGLYWNKLFPSV